MREIQVLLVALVVLLGGAYASWMDDGKKVTEETVAIAQATPDEVTSLRLVTTTQTVAMSYETDPDGKKYPWFTIETKASTRYFVGSKKTESLLDNFAPFEALRSLGVGHDEAALDEMGLSSPQRTLTVGIKGQEQDYDLGGRTYGSRDHYVRPVGSEEVFIVKNKSMSDLEFPEGRFMQRKLRAVALEDVAHVTISAGGELAKVLQKNRLSRKDAFWASEAEPDVRSESFENYLDKLEKLTVSSFGTDKSPVEPGDPSFEVTWHDDSGEVLEHLTVYKKQDKGEAAEYTGKSGVSHVPARLSRSIAEQLERDLSVVFGE